MMLAGPWLATLALVAAVRSPVSLPGLRVGVVLGDGAAGREMQAGAEAARAALAASGVGAVTLLAVTADRSWTGAPGPIARLVFDGQVDALIEAGDAELAHVAAQVATRAGLPLITLSAETQLTAMADRWVFRIAPSDREQAAEVLARGTRGMPDARVRLVVPRGREGRERLAALRAGCRDAGIAGTRVEQDDATARALEPIDLVMLWLDAPEAAAWLRQQVHRPGAGRLAGSVRLAGREPGALLLAARQRMLLPRLGEETVAAGADPGAALGHDAVAALAAARNRAGSRDPRALRKALLQLREIAGQSGRFRFGSDGARISTCGGEVSQPHCSREKGAS